jgi:hypothetical protein
MRWLFSVGLAVLLWGTFGSGEARAIPIVWGEGDTVKHVADLPPQVIQKIAQQRPGERLDKLGFMYWHFHIFWADLWTSGGTFVIYHDTTKVFPVKLDAREVAQLCELPEDKVSTPFLYHVPMGWMILAGIVLFAIVANFIEKAQKKRMPPEPTPGLPEVVQLLADPRYQQALEAMNPNGVPAEQLSTSDIQRGIDSLIAQEVPREQAEANLAQLLEFMRNPQQGGTPPGKGNEGGTTDRPSGE